MTKTYQVYMPVELAVEADSLSEAHATLFRLWKDVTEALPTGASAGGCDDRVKEHITINTAP